MKTRAEIYGNEAADLLRIVTMYPGLCEHQLLCFHPGKEDTTRPCSLIWRGRAAFFKQTAAVISWQGKHQKLTMRLSGQCGSCWTSSGG